MKPRPITNPLARKSAVAGSAATESADTLTDGFHFRGQLPHLKRQGATYFVTFRLADSLPAAEVLRLKHERDSLLTEALDHRRPLSWREEQLVVAWYSDRVEKLLDAGPGACWLNRHDIAELVAGAVKFFEGQRYDLPAWVVMPNHVHAVVQPRSGQRLSEILHSWKSYTATQANRLLGRSRERFWQKESFDHWIRDEAECHHWTTYVENNPVKAGLCAGPEDWHWSSAGERARANRAPSP